LLLRQTLSPNTNQNVSQTHGKLTFAPIPIHIANTPRGLICGALTMSAFRFYCLWCYDLIGSKTLDSVSYCRANLNKSRSRVECNCWPTNLTKKERKQRKAGESKESESQFLAQVNTYASLQPTQDLSPHTWRSLIWAALQFYAQWLA